MTDAGPLEQIDDDDDSDADDLLPPTLAGGAAASFAGLDSRPELL